ncbi:MAG: hypothetical protein H6Q68_2582 [Firmicutes bacterium]|nr:hypothetical protein [Bacillota bacterium]
MRKLVMMLVFSLLFISSSVVFANLNDNRATIQAQYGDYRLIIDSDNQLWTKADWEANGYKKAKAASYMYSFTRQGLRIQMEVLYDNEKSESLVRTQRFTPDMAIKLKEFKLYFPEVYMMITAPKAQVFATNNPLSRHFQDIESPIRMGVLIKELANGKNGSYYPLLAFNIQDEGRLIKDTSLINEDTYIREFTIERTYRTTVHDAMDSSKPEWKIIKSHF